MGGSSRPGSSRVSMFSDDQEEVKIPIIEQQDSRAKHLAAKAGEWNEPGVREGLYTASLIYMKHHGNESRGGKLSSSKTVRLECGEVIGEASRILRMSIDARGRYRAMKQKIFRHAFVSPFEMMEMLMAINGEKEAKYRIIPGTAGGERVYSTLNIMMEAANEKSSVRWGWAKSMRKFDCWEAMRAG